MIGVLGGIGILFLSLSALFFFLAEALKEEIAKEEEKKKNEVASNVNSDVEAYEKELKNNPDWANEIYRGWDETISPVYTPMEWVADEEKKSEKMG